MPNATATKERPILFSAPMIKALLEGRKTQTRRTVKPQPLIVVEDEKPPYVDWKGPVWCCNSLDAFSDWATECAEDYCPYGKPGDRLWVKETWSPDHAAFYPNFPIVFRAEGYPTPSDIEAGKMFSPEAKAHFPFRWRPSIHMPRRLSRITLEITDVRVERVEEISEADALAEGIELGESLIHKGKSQPPGTMHYTVRSNPEIGEPTASAAFLSLFYDINKRAKRGSNPWVWALTFKVASHA